MEATIQSNNNVINIDINVSVNVEALKAIIQHGLQSIRQHCNVGAWSLPRLYRKELCLTRAVARAIDAHPTLSNIAFWVQTFVGIYLIFMYA